MGRSGKAAAFGIAVALMMTTLGFAFAQTLPPGGTFVDDDGNIHEANIEAIAAEGITLGCNPPTNDMYCPSSVVTRGAMAAFLVRAFDLTDGGGDDLFTDDDESIFETDIDKLATAGITLGCNPPDNDNYCPDAPVIRGAMAAFLVRAMGLTDDGGGDLFIDDDGSIFEADIDKLGTAGITAGCNPPDNDMFCPDQPVLRDQMASFLARALGLDPIQPPPPTSSTTSTSTTTTTTTAPTTTTSSPTTTTTVAPEVVEVSIFDFGYTPEPVMISVGDTIEWTNDGEFPHTTTAGTAAIPTGDWDSLTLNFGETFSRTFDDPGTFDYFCTVHPGSMSGTVIVEE